MRFDHVLFDLDGTLTESGEGITKCAARAIEAMGYPALSEETLSQFIGPPLKWAFIHLAGMREAEAYRAMEIYRERFDALGWAENRVYPGIAALLKALKAAGAYVAIATAKPEKFAIRIAEHFGLAPHLDAVCGIRMDEHGAEKVDIIRRALPKGANPARAAMIGDRRFDVEGARAAGVFSIAVGYGYGSKEELLAAEPDAFCEAVADLFPLLEVGRPRGKFLTFEGMDGCGKSTQLNLLADWLRLRGHEVLLTREPGGCPISERIRRLVLDIGAEGMTDECEALLFAASRAQHVEDVILPALLAGKIVLCDRFLDSSIAYQAHGRELGEPFVRQINKPARRAVPDLTLLYTVDVDRAKLRVLGSGAPDRIEVEEGGYYRRVDEAYRALQRAEPERIHAIDASAPIDAVFLRTLELAKDFLQKE